MASTSQAAGPTANPGKQALVEQEHRTAATALAHPADTKIANAIKMDVPVSRPAMTNGIEHGYYCLENKPALEREQNL